MGSGGQHRSAPLLAYREKFYELFPYYLALGMTAKEYWDGDCDLVKYYRKAAEIKRDLQNQEAWLQGAYFYEALLDAAPILRSFGKKGTKPTPYREAPYEMSQRRKENGKPQAQNAKALAFMHAFALTNNKKFATKERTDNELTKKGGGRNE